MGRNCVIFGQHTVSPFINKVTKFQHDCLNSNWNMNRWVKVWVHLHPCVCRRWSVNIIWSTTAHTCMWSTSTISVFLTVMILTSDKTRWPKGEVDENRVKKSGRLGSHAACWLCEAGWWVQHYYMFNLKTFSSLSRLRLPGFLLSTDRPTYHPDQTLTTPEYRQALHITLTLTVHLSTGTPYHPDTDCTLEYR